MSEKLHKALLTKVQTGRNWLKAHVEGFDDDAYRRLLVDFGGATGEKPSSKDKGVDLVNVAERMHDLGFPRTRPARAGRLPNMAQSKQALGAKIDALLAEAGKSTNYADGIAKRMYRIERVEFLTIPQLIGVVTALEKQAKKVKA